MMADLQRVPEVHRASALDALRAAGMATIERVVPIVGGASGALVYRVDSREERRLLRIETARDPFRNPLRGYACMRRAAEAGVAPALHHADPGAGIAVMDFVEVRPLAAYPGGKAAMLAELGALLARLHATPLFPPMLPLPDLLSRLLHRVTEEGLLRPGLLAPHAQALARVCAAYPWRRHGTVSSHNDVNAGNVLFDGARLWLVDWEIAFENEPLFDLALATINFGAPPPRTAQLLAAYLQRSPTRGELARVALLRQLGLLFYGCVMLSTAFGGSHEPGELPVLSEDDYQALTEARGAGPGGASDLPALGKLMLAAYLFGMQTAEIEAALADAQRA